MQTETTEKQPAKFVSETFNHFEGGVLFPNIDSGLQILWDASFYKGNVYKENLGFILPNGLLIAPNQYNTSSSARICALSLHIKSNKLYVEFRNTWVEVLAIIHSHPNSNGQKVPTSRHDYYYCYLGIHNYVLNRYSLYDAYWTSKGKEAFKRINREYAGIYIRAQNEKDFLIMATTMR